MSRILVVLIAASIMPARAGDLAQLAARFEEPLLATGPVSAGENTALAAAIQAYESRPAPDDFAALDAFLADYPHSGWRIALLTNLGLGYYRYGYFTKAMDAWEKAWQDGRELTGPDARRLVDRAVGELIRMHARLGHADALEALFRDLGGRQVTGPATEAVAGARQGLSAMRHEPGFAYLCGPAALRNLLLTRGFSADAVRFLDDVRSGTRGTSLADVDRLARRAHLPHRVIFRLPGQSVPVPSIVHWKVMHFAAIVAEESGMYHVQDPTFGQDLWITRGALESESSGYFLIPAGIRNLAWRTVSSAESEKVRGMGLTSLQQPGANTPDEFRTNPCGKSDQPAANPPNPGMCGYNITLMTVSVNLNDTPVGYTPPIGPDAHVTLTYNQREDSQPATFAWFNVSQKWSMNWLSYIEEQVVAGKTNGATRHVAGGGSVSYVPTSSGFTAEQRDSSILVKVSSAPIVYEHRLPDGTREVYSQDNGATSPRRIFLTQVIDPAGNAVKLTYDGQMRLTTLTDASDRNTTFSYELSARPLLVTKITDPFGRSAQLTYDSAGRMIQITDVLGLASQFTYDAASLIDSMTTPYGTTKFAYGESGTTRFVEATDPLGYTERVEFRHQAPGIANNDPAATIPKGLTRAVDNTLLFYRNTFYWDKHAFPIAAGSYTKARIFHFHHWAGNFIATSRSIESIKPPLENRIWYTYPGQISSTFSSGILDKPASFGRALDDGTSSAALTDYNVMGNITDVVDAAGRETQFVYAANNIDLTQIKQRTSTPRLGVTTIGQLTYNSQHRPVKHTDAAGQTTAYAYNPAGQLTKVTNALGETTSYEYDSQGYLLRVVNADGQDAAIFTYDAFGRMASRTDSEGYTVNFAYDMLDRLVQETYPDGTTSQYTWDRLDLASVTDRQGRVTQYTHDALRNLIGITDAMGRQTRLTYYENGVLKSITDPNNNTTSWDVDLEGRVTARHYPDGKVINYTYEASTGRVKSITDALGQVTQFSYTLDHRIKSITHTKAINPTPDVSFTYDTFFPRPTSMTDGVGATRYTYQAIGSPGALKLILEDGPRENDTIAYQYDALGRVVSRTVDTGVETFTYDPLGRIAAHASPLGTFNLSYLGETRQMTGRHIDGGTLGTDLVYDTNSNDRRLLSIAPSGTARGYQYSTTPENIISQIVESAGMDHPFAPQTWSYSYDNVDRLLGGVSSSGDSYSYGYDPADNITSSQTPAGSGSTGYNAVNQVSGFVYDLNGNLTADGQRVYKWDAENRLISVASKAQPDRATLFRYDGLGRRVAIVSPDGGETRYLWCGESICQSRTAADVVVRRYYPEGELTSGGRFYYAQDHLGSVRDVLSIDDGSRVASFDYDAYGNPIQTDGALTTDFRFAGMFYEPSSGLYLASYRVYDPKTGRWLSRDPIGIADGMNLYVYAGDDPVNKVDPQGLCETEPSIGLKPGQYGPPDPFVDGEFPWVGPKPWRPLDPVVDWLNRKLDPPKPLPVNIPRGVLGIRA